ECIDKGVRLVHDPYADDPLITPCFAPHSTYVVSDESFRKLRVAADQIDARIQIHLHETAREVEDARRATGMRPIERLRENGRSSASLRAVHAVNLTEVEIAAFARSGIAVDHCPRSNQKPASGIAPVAALRAAGVIIGLGTDGAASN